MSNEILLTSMPYLSNGRHYEGSVYFLLGYNEADVEGQMYAFCSGGTWGLDCAGTCLAPLYTEDKKPIIIPSLAGKEGYAVGRSIHDIK